MWDVLRVVDREDPDNPVRGIGDGVAPTAQPGLLACWPSLYEALYKVVLENGVPEADLAGDSEPARRLLLANLQPLLENAWHSNFDETILGYRNEDGTFLKLKKMKHLLNAVLRWRDEFVAGRQSHRERRTALDEVLSPALDLVPSTRHNDLVLRCSKSPLATPVVRPIVKSNKKQTNALKLELERLRSENAALRGKNDSSEVNAQADEPLMLASLQTPHLPADIFDDPCEPSPETPKWNAMPLWQDAPSCAMSWRSRVSSTDFDEEDARSIMS